jgi:ribonuclease BN (tRNA processing enzyme)
MKLLLLGTSGYHPTERRQTACLMLPDAGIVLDAGTGFFRVREHLVGPTLDIFLTHAHLDHVVGLTFLLSTVWEKPVERIVVHGEAEKLAAVREHLLSQYLFPAPLPCLWQPLPSGATQCGAVRITHFPLEHPGGSVGYRLDCLDASRQSRSMAYVTDTTATPAAPYVEHLRGVDLLVHECNFRDEADAWAVKTGHSSTTQVAKIAARAGVKRLVLLHFNSLDNSDDPIDLAAAQRIFPATELGEDRMEVEW